MINAYKLVSLRKDGSIGPLFIDKSFRFPIGKWLKCKSIHKKGFKYRPGFHACSALNAPHLSKKNRVWVEVSLKNVEKHNRPDNQGGLWYVAKEMRIERVIVDGEE